MAACFKKGLDVTAAALSWKLKLMLLFFKDYDNYSMLLSFHFVIFNHICVSVKSTGAILMRQQLLFLESEVAKILRQQKRPPANYDFRPFATLPIIIKTSEGKHAKCVPERDAPHECLSWRRCRLKCPDGLHARSQITTWENETDSDKSVRRANLPVATLWLPKIWCCLPLKNLPPQDLINKNEPWSKHDLYQPLWKGLAERQSMPDCICCE